MSTLHSFSIRRRSTKRTTDSDSNPPSKVATTVQTAYTLKTFFHRKASSNRKTSADVNTTDKPKSILKTDPDASTMGNAPSDMNPQGQGVPQTNGTTVNGTLQKPLDRPPTIASESSIRSRAMPGAEPPTPIPAEPIVTTEHPPNTPHMEKVQVQGYEVSEQIDLEEGLIPPVHTFALSSGEPLADPQAEMNPLAAEDASAAADPVLNRTPRAELKTEELLAPLDFTPSRSPPGHTADASDATAVAISPSARSPQGPTPSMWTPGTYVLLNAHAGTAMDLHGLDYTSIIGYPMHGGPNQQWEFIPSGHGYIIRCVRPAKEGHALYLTVEGGLRNNAPVVASAYPVTWSVEQTEDGIRISWPNSSFVFDQADKIQLMPLVPGEPRQLWHYTRCVPADREHEKGMEVEVHSERAMSHPATTDTVTITEESEFVTTTRTTTTTVLTTVTEVTRTPKALFHRQAQNQHKSQRRSIGYR